MVKVKIALLTAAGILLVSQFASASTVVVGHCKSGVVTFTTIQDAVDHSPSGGTILVCPGNYPEQVTILDKSLTIKGAQAGTQYAAVVTSPGAGVAANAPDLRGGGRSPLGAQIWVTSDANATGTVTVNISNLTVDGANNGIPDCNTDLIGILYQNASGTITRVATRNQIIYPYSTNGGCQSGMGVLVQNDNTVSPNSTSAVTVSNSTVHNFQKNGIAAQLEGATLTATGNTVLGLGPTTGAAQNGIEIAYGASGKVTTNAVSDVEWTGGTTDTASGILIYASGSIPVTGNTVANAQSGIVSYESGNGAAILNSITSNKVYGSHVFDGIDVCSNQTTVKSNTVNSADQSGIHNDSTCGGNTGNVITNNTINEACAGLLTGNAPPTANTLSPNTFFNVINTVVGGDSCATPVFTNNLASSNLAAQSTHLAVQP